MRKSNEWIVGKLRGMVFCDAVEEKYKSRPTDFSRTRILPFSLLVLFMLRKLYRSLSLELSSFFEGLGQPGSRPCTVPTKSAFTQARAKLSPQFFADMLARFNQEFYSDNDERVKLFLGFRLLAVDGSTLDMPDSPELKGHFGTTSNQHRQVRYCKARVSLLYDVANQLVVDARLQPFSQGEPGAALAHLSHCQKGDLLLFDRGYASYELINALRQAKLHLLMRVKVGFSNVVKSFAHSAARDKLVLIHPGKNAPMQDMQDKPYSRQHSRVVRLVKGRLPGSQQEFVLLTSLLDKKKYPVNGLLQAYQQRWQVETAYDIVKNVLQVECFSGYSLKAIEQDFFISLLLLNLKSLLSEGLEEELQKHYGQRKHRYQVNASLAIGQLKNQVVQLFTTQGTLAIIDYLQQSFLRYVEPVRANRSYPRNPDKYRQRKKPLLFNNRKPVL